MIYDTAGVSRWWSADTIVVVTGANRGIGFEIVHQLALHGVTVILTSRDAAVGEEAAKVLQEGGLNVFFHQLDIVDPSSIKAFCEWLQQNYGGLDILVKCLFQFDRLKLTGYTKTFHCPCIFLGFVRIR